jgi:hypothetical protein
VTKAHARGLAMPLLRQILASVIIIFPIAISGIGSSSAQPTALDVSDVFLQYYNVSPSLLYGLGGEGIRYGSDAVTPNGDVTTNDVGVATTGTATTTNLYTGATIEHTIPFDPAPDDPDFYQGSFLICTTNCMPAGNNNPTNLVGPWTITFQNIATSPTSVANTISLAGPGEIPVVGNVTLSTAGTYPTFSWTPPAGVGPTGVPIQGYRVDIIENDLPGNGTVVTATLPSTTTSYTVQPSDFTVPGFGFKPGTAYTIAILALQTRDGSTTNLGNENVSASSETFSSFQTLPAGAPPVYLPVTTVTSAGAVYSFNLTVAPGVTYYIDPEVAIGYIYQTGARNPNFASVELPDIGNPNPYDLYLWNGSEFVFDTTLAADTLFDFATGGVNEFEVLGIDPDLGLDPDNTTAFMTPLTFDSTGDFTGTMTPVTANVPEPGSLALFTSGLFGLGLICHRRKTAARGWRLSRCTRKTTRLKKRVPTRSSYRRRPVFTPAMGPGLRRDGENGGNGTGGLRSTIGRTHPE